VKADQEFCGKCGTKLENNGEIKTCSKCGVDIETQAMINQVTPTKLESRSSSIRKISLVVGIIVGIYTFFLILTLIDYNMRLSTVREMAFGLGNLIVARIAPSIEMGNIVGVLFLVETILLFPKPKRVIAISVLILSLVNILLTLVILDQIPQILYALFVLVSIGVIFNILNIIFVAATYKKIQ